MGVELEDIVERLTKEKKREKKLRLKQDKLEKEQWREERRSLMKFTSSQKWKLNEGEQRQLWKIFKARRKEYYRNPRGVVYLSSIPHGFYEEQMVSYFSQFGKITGIYMPRAPSGKARGYAFIEFQLEVIAKIVAETMNNYLFYQRILKAKYIPPEQQKPYMFVFPYGDNRKKSVKIEKERELRSKPVTNKTEYKEKIQRDMEKMKKKLNAVGADYSFQISGEPPISKPKKIKTKILEEENKPERKETKENKLQKEDDVKLKIKNLLDKKLAKKIKENIALKLSGPLGSKKSKQEEIDQDKEENGSEDSDEFDLDDEDFETAEEDNFMSFNEEDESEEENGDEGDSDEEVESPIKKKKVDNKQKRVNESMNKQEIKKKVESPGVENKTNTDKSPKSNSKKQVTPKSAKNTPQLEKHTPKSAKNTPQREKYTPKAIKNTPKITKESTKSNKKTPKSQTKITKTPDQSEEKVTPKPVNKKDKQSPSVIEEITSKSLKKNKTPNKQSKDKKLLTPKSDKKDKKVVSKLNFDSAKKSVKRKSTASIEGVKIKTPKVKKMNGKSLPN